MEEIWKPIPILNSVYYASNLGNIKRLSYCLLKKQSKIKRSYSNGFKEKFVSQHENKLGYMYVCLKDGRTYLSHRLIALAFIKNEYLKPFVNHKDLNRKNNNVENLEWVTNIENIHHAISLGKFNYKRKPRKHSDYVVKKIKSLYGIIPVKDIAKKYSCSRHFVWGVCNKRYRLKG